MMHVGNNLATKNIEINPFIDYTVGPRNNGSQGFNCFFPVVPNSGVAILTIFDRN